MRQKIIKVLAYLGLVIVAVLAWAWYDIYIKPMRPDLHEKLKMLVAKYPELEPSYAKYMEDGVLTLSEGNALLRELGNKKDKKKQ